jgi:hypothetical protein
MTKFAVLALAGCIPVTTTTTTSQPAASRSTQPTTPGAGGSVDDRAAMYAQEAPAVTSHEVFGTPLDSTPKPCTAAQNHCMRGGWFATEASAGYAQRALPVVPRSETEWFDYRGKPATDEYGTLLGHKFRTEPATAQTYRYNSKLIVFCGKGALPSSEAEMLTSSDWYLVIGKDFDAAAGAIEIDRSTNPEQACPATVPIGLARAVVEFK